MSGLTIGVIGAGLMGHGIAYLLAAAGHTVRIYDPSAEWREIAARAAGKRARAARRRSGAARPHLGARPDEAPAMAGRDLRVRGRAGKAAAQAAAVRRAGKPHRARHDPRQQQLGDSLDPRSARSSSTASRVVGTHFWNPPHLVPLVEVIQNESTSDETVRKTMELLRDAGRKPGACQEGHPGLRRQPAATCAQARGDRAGRRPASATPTPSTRW